MDQKKIKDLKDLIDHVCSTWQKKKGAKYPFNRGKDAKLLNRLCDFYEPWGVAALWDCYLICNSEFAQKTGYTIGIFKIMIPKLVDMSWKPIARKYDPYYGNEGEILRKVGL